MTIARKEGAKAQLAKIDEMTKAKASGSKAPASSKTKAKKKTLKGAAETSDQDAGSPPIVPKDDDQSDTEQQDSDPADADDSEEVDDSEEEERLFFDLKVAWDTAPQSVRKRFVKEVLHLDLGQIDDDIWTAKLLFN